MSGSNILFGIFVAGAVFTNMQGMWSIEGLAKEVGIVRSAEEIAAEKAEKAKEFDDFLRSFNEAIVVDLSTINTTKMTDVEFTDKVEDVYVGKRISSTDRLYDLVESDRKAPEGWSYYRFSQYNPDIFNDNYMIRGECLVREDYEDRLRSTQTGEYVVIYGEVASAGKLLGFKMESKRCVIGFPD